MARTSIRWQLFRLHGMPVSVEASWLIASALLGLTIAIMFPTWMGWHPNDANISLSLDESWIMALVAMVTALAFFGCVLVHELAHAIVARFCGTPVRAIVLLVFGGVTELGNEPTSAKNEFVVGVAGPVVSGILGITFVLLSQWGYDAGWTQATVVALGCLAFINLLVLAFNLIPVVPFDGGRVLHSILWWLTGNREGATYGAALTGQVFAMLLVAWGLAQFLSAQWIGGIWLGALGLSLSRASVPATGVFRRAFYWISLASYTFAGLLMGLGVVLFFTVNWPFAAWCIFVGLLLNNAAPPAIENLHERASWIMLAGQVVAGLLIGVGMIQYARGHWFGGVSCGLIGLLLNNAAHISSSARQFTGFRFSLRSLFALVLALAVPLGFVAHNMQEAAKQRQAVEALDKAGVYYLYDYEYRPTTNDALVVPNWLRSLLGKDFFHWVTCIETPDDVDEPEYLAHLEKLGHLELVSLNTPIGDEAAAHLSGLVRLKQLYLHKCEFTDEGLKRLSKLVDLEQLWLWEGHFTGAGFVKLQDLTKLQELSLSSVDFDDTGMNRLQGLSRLRILTINSGHVGEKGLAALSKLPSLERLTLRDAGITDAGLERLGNQPKLEYLDLAFNPDITDAGLEHVGHLSQLVELDLLNDRGIRGKGFVHLQKLENLNSLQVAGTNTDDDGLAILTQFARLASLDLDGLPITDAGMVHLANMRQLTELSIDSPRVTNAGLAYLTGLTRLDSLSINSPNVTDEGLAHLAVLTNLSSLDLRGCDITDAGLSHLGNFRRLLFLKLSSRGIHGEGLAGLGSLTRLRYLSLPGCSITDTSIPYLKQLPALKFLYVDSNTFTQNGRARLKPVQVLEGDWGRESPQAKP